MKNATAFILLAISMVVAVMNCLFGKYYYILFAVPFIFAIFTNKEKSILLQILGLSAIGCYVLNVEYYFGMMIFFASGIMVYLNYDRSKSYLFMVVSSVAVGFFSMVGAADSVSVVTHVFLDVFVYVFACGLMMLVVHDYKREIAKRSRTIDQKYIEVIDELQRVAHESIDILKQIQDEARDDRPRKNC